MIRTIPAVNTAGKALLLAVVSASSLAAGDYKGSGDFVQDVKAAGSDVSDGAGEAWDATKKGADETWDATKKGAGKAWGATKEGAGNVFDAVKNAVD